MVTLQTFMVCCRGEALEFRQFFLEIKSQGSAGQIDPQILLQAQGDLDPLDLDGRKTPVLRIVADGADNPFVYHLVNHLGVDPAQVTALTQGKKGVFVKGGAGQYGGSHDCLPSPIV